MENIQYITLDLMNNKSFDYVYTKQYDVGRAVVFSITKDGEPVNLSGLSAIFSMTKPDGSVILYSSTDDEITINPNSTITLILTDQITVLSGKLPYQISLMDGTRVVSTITGIIYCEKAAVQMDDMRSVSDGSLIEDLAIVAQAIKDGEIHGGDVVNVSATLQSGVEIGEISVNDVPTKLYSPGDFLGTSHGLVPASDGATTKFLRGDGAWTNPFITTSQSIISASTASRWAKIYDPEVTTVSVSNLITVECPQNPETPYTAGNSEQVAIYTLPIPTKVKKIKIALRTYESYLSSLPDIVIGVKNTLDVVNPPAKTDNDWITTLYENRQNTDVDLELNVDSESPYYLYIFGWAWNFEISSITFVENVVPTTIPEMSDVNISALSEGQVLKYNSSTQRWVNANESGGASTLDDLTDVNVLNPTAGQILTYDDVNNEWVNANASGGGGGAAESLDTGYVEISVDTFRVHDSAHMVLEDYSDITLSSGYWDSGALEPYYTSLRDWAYWVTQNIDEGGGGGGGGSALDDLSDVSLNSPSDGDFLMYNDSSGEWENTQLTVPDFDGTNSGLVPEPGSGDSDKFLKADGTWATLASSGAIVDPDFEDAITNGYFTFGYGWMQASGGAGASAISYGYDDIQILYLGYWLDDGENTYDSVKDSFARIQTEIDDINTELTNMSSGITTSLISLERGDITNTGYYWDGTHVSLLNAMQSLTQRIAALEAIVNP